MKIFGDHLQEYINHKGWKVVEFQRRTKVSQSTLSLILTGKTRNPGLDVFLKIVNNTDVNPNFLITGRGSKTRPEGKLFDVSTEALTSTEGGEWFSRDQLQEAVAVMSTLLKDRGLSPEKRGRMAWRIAQQLATGRTVEEVMDLVGGVLEDSGALEQPQQ